MADDKNVNVPPTSVEEMQKGWHELTLRVSQLEASHHALEQAYKALRQQLESVVQHRLKSHTELVILLTNLVSKLPLNDVGVLISKLMEHNASVTQFLSGTTKPAGEVSLDQAGILKTLEQTKRDLTASIKELASELLQLDVPIEKDLVQGLMNEPESFFTPRMVRATRCFVKGQVSRERIFREYGDQGLAFFNDMTTDPKLNPRPKPDEIVLCFRSDFDGLLQQDSKLSPEKRQELRHLSSRVQASKGTAEEARKQRNVFNRLSFALELLHYYEHQNTEAPETTFAQRLPALIDQLVVTNPHEPLDQKLIFQAEALIGMVINPDHRQSVINNVGKAGGAWKTLRFVLKLRGGKVADSDHVIAEFVKHLIQPPPEKPPTPSELGQVLLLLPPEMQRAVLRGIMSSDRIGKHDAEVLAKATAAEIGLPADQVKPPESASPEIERQVAWGRIKDMIARRGSPATITAAVRERLNAHYDAEEIRQSWLALTEADPILLIRIFCQLPYLASGKTDAIARPVLETYVSRLTHEKYAATYNRVLRSLRSMFQAKPDSPTLTNFVSLVRWISPEAADKLCADIGMQAQAH
jgi:hypothetical protein